MLRIRDVYPGSRILIFDNCHYALKYTGLGSGKNLVRIPDPGVKKAPDPGSGTLPKSYWIRNPPHCVIFGFPPPPHSPSPALVSVDAPDPP